MLNMLATLTEYDRQPIVRRVDTGVDTGIVTAQVNGTRFWY
jgi:hypothetical protein